MDTRIGPMRKGIRFLSSQGVLLGAAALVLASSAIVGSGTLAGFQATTTNGANTFSSGILRITNVSGANGTGTDCTADTGGTVGVLTGTCKQLINASLRVPGDATSQTVTITNVGNVNGLLSLSMGTQTSGNALTPSTTGGIPACVATDYPSRLKIDIKQGTTTVLAQTALNGVSGAIPLSPNTFTPGQSVTYTVDLAFDSTADNTYQNCTAAFPLTWTMDQRAANLTSAPNASGASN